MKGGPPLLFLNFYEQKIEKCIIKIKNNKNGIQLSGLY